MTCSSSAMVEARGVYVMVGGSTRRIVGCLLLGPLISLAGSKKMGFLWWKPSRRTMSPA